MTTRAVPLAARPLRGRPKLGGPKPIARARSQGAVSYIFSHFASVAIIFVIAAHLLLGAEEHPLVTRLLLSVPAILFVVEAREYLKSDMTELPFQVLAMIQYYAMFGVACFFDLPFFDLSGPVYFSPTVRITAGMIVALGALSVYAGARLGRYFGTRFHAFAPRVLPPSKTPARWNDAFFVYGGLVIVFSLVNTFAQTLVPGALAVPVSIVFPLEFAIGLAAARPPTGLARRADQFFTALGMGTGLLRGQLEPVFRICIAFGAGRWITTRKVAFGLIGLLVAIFLVVQPAKSSYREQIWGHAAKTGEDVGFSGRVNAWESSLEGSFSDEGHRTDNSQPAVARLSELGSVMHALTVVPARIDYLYGESLLQILYSPIPRVIWADKPTSMQEVGQRYAVIFGRQTERGAQTTAVGLCLLVEGWWNFGWLGVVLVSLVTGMVVGASQKIFSGENWALRAIGIAQMSTLIVGGTAVILLSSMFQYIVGRLLATWGVYWLAQLLSDRERTHKTLAFGTRPAPTPSPAEPNA